MSDLSPAALASRNRESQPPAPMATRAPEIPEVDYEPSPVVKAVKEGREATEEMRIRVAQKETPTPQAQEALEFSEAHDLPYEVTKRNLQTVKDRQEEADIRRRRAASPSINHFYKDPINSEIGRSDSRGLSDAEISLAQIGGILYPPLVFAEAMGWLPNTTIRGEVLATIPDYTMKTLDKFGNQVAVTAIEGYNDFKMSNFVHYGEAALRGQTRPVYREPGEETRKEFNDKVRAESKKTTAPFFKLIAEQDEALKLMTPKGMSVIEEAALGLPSSLVISLGSVGAAAIVPGGGAILATTFAGGVMGAI